MTNDDPILGARSISALMQALDEVYGWTLPQRFPAGTALGELWAIPVTVHSGTGTGALYLATAGAGYAIGAALQGMVAAQVLPAAAGATTTSAVSRLTPPLEEYLA